MKNEYFTKDNAQAVPPESDSNQADETDPLTEYLDGMGTATARILIDRHIDDKVLEKYGLKELKNAGRYYIAQIKEANGKLIDEVLVDKQTGNIRSLRRKISSL